MLESARPEDREAVEALARQVHGLHVSWRPDLYVMRRSCTPRAFTIRRWNRKASL